MVLLSPPDEKKLYVADTGENIKHLYVYDMIDGLPRNRKLVYDFKPFFLTDLDVIKTVMFGQVLEKQ